MASLVEVPSEGRRVPVDEDRFLFIEDTIEAMSGTVLDLSSKFDQFEGLPAKFDQLENRFDRVEKLLEELTRSGKDSKNPNPNQVLSPPVQTPVAAQSPLLSLHKEHETRIKILAAAAQKHRIKILAAAVQKYKVKRDSKSFEEQLQKPGNDLLNLPSTFPSSPLPATVVIESEKVEHSKDFHSEVQPVELDLKVFDNMSLSLDEEDKMKLEAEEDVSLDFSATENDMSLGTTLPGKISSSNCKVIMEDHNCHVKDATAWTLGRIFEILHSPNIAYAGYEDTESALLLIPYLGNIISALTSAVDHADTSISKLQVVTYEIQCCKLPETTNMIAQLFLESLTRLTKTMEIQIMSSDDREKQSDLQALLCGVLQVMVWDPGKMQILQYKY